MTFTLREAVLAVLLIAALMWVVYQQPTVNYEIQKLQEQVEKYKYLSRQADRGVLIGAPEGSPHSVVIGYGAGMGLIHGSHVLIGNEHIKYDTVLIGSVDLLQLVEEVRELKRKSMFANK